MSEVQSGLEGVVAFATEIAEPDREGSALRYRGVDIEDLVGAVRFEQVWGLLVDGHLEPGLPPAQPHPLAVRSGARPTQTTSRRSADPPDGQLRGRRSASGQRGRLSDEGPTYAGPSLTTAGRGPYIIPLMSGIPPPPPPPESLS
jgi:citrate synthase